MPRCTLLLPISVSRSDTASHRFKFFASTLCPNRRYLVEIRARSQQRRSTDYRKKFSEMGLRITPTNLRDRTVIAFSDYELKSAKKSRAELTLPLPSSNYKSIYFLNFLLSPQSPSNPEPRRSMVAGSGTIAGVVEMTILSSQKSLVPTI